MMLVDRSAAISGNTRSGVANGRADVAQARTQLVQVQLASAQAIGAETERAQARVRNLTQTAMEAQDALSQARQSAAGRVADLDGRLRQLARPLPCSGAAPAEVMDRPVPDYPAWLERILSSSMARLSLSSPSARAPSAKP